MGSELFGRAAARRGLVVVGISAATLAACVPETTPPTESTVPWPTTTAATTTTTTVVPGEGCVSGPIGITEGGTIENWSADGSTVIRHGTGPAGPLLEWYDVETGESGILSTTASTHAVASGDGDGFLLANETLSSTATLVDRTGATTTITAPGTHRFLPAASDDLSKVLTVRFFVPGSYTWGVFDTTSGVHTVIPSSVIGTDETVVDGDSTLDQLIIDQNSGGGQFKVVDLPSGTTTRTFTNVSDGDRQVRFADDSAIFASGGRPSGSTAAAGSAIWYSPTTTDEFVQEPPAAGATAIAATGDRSRVVFQDNPSLLSLVSGGESVPIALPSTATAISVSPQLDRVLSRDGAAGWSQHCLG